MTIKRYFGMKRREFFGVAAASLSLPATQIASADDCEITPPTDEGPLYPVEDIPWVSDLTRVEGGGGVAEGRHVYLFGQVRNADCQPATDATVEIWQADSRGQYKHPRHAAAEDLDPNFQYFGKVKVDEQGRYLFKSVLPKWYRIFDIDRAEHIHLRIRSTANGVLTTEVYFEGEGGDVRRSGDRVYQGIGNKEKLILATDSRENDIGLDIPAEADTAYCRFDVMYRI